MQPERNGLSEVFKVAALLLFELIPIDQPKAKPVSCLLPPSVTSKRASERATGRVGDEQQLKPFEASN